MLFAEALSGLQLVLLGLSILAVAFVLRRGIVLGRRSRNRDVAAEVRAEIRAARQTTTSRIEQLEVRLYDYGREVEGRIGTRISQLDRLVVEADQEIERLRQLLEQSSRVAATAPMRHGPDIMRRTTPEHSRASAETSVPAVDEPVSPLTSEQRWMLVHLEQAGYAPEQIARLLGLREIEIRSVLQAEKRRPGREAA